MAIAWAALVALSGGVTLNTGAGRLASRDPLRPLLAGAVLSAAAWGLLGSRESRRLLRTAAGARRGAVRAAVGVSIAAAIASAAWNTRAAGGSDSSCYVLQAEALARGRATLASSLAQPPPGATAAALAPGGFVPSPTPPHAAVPICAAGLAVVMVPAFLIDRDAVFYVVPLFAGLAVWCTFLLGRAMHDDITGVCAALLVACSPIFLYQAVQPMSDVPAAALWLAALVALGPSASSAPRQIVAGACASLAVLMRPNVALIVLPLLALLPGVTGWLRFGAATLPAAIAMAALNAARYGSPLASGYGSTDVLFSLAHLGPNLARYPAWLVQTETPLLTLAPLGAVLAYRGGQARFAAVATMGVVLTAATYLAYTVFNEWWYIRFLLPAVPVLLVFGVVAARWLAAWAVPRYEAAAIVLLSLVLGAWSLEVARERQVFNLAALESRFRLTGEYAARSFPDTAVVLAAQVSGSVRYFGRRDTINWDALAPGSLQQTVTWLGAQRRPVYLALEDQEVEAFRQRFAADGLGSLDWPPRVEVHAPVRVRLYAPEDRAIYLSRGRLDTQHIR